MQGRITWTPYDYCFPAIEEEEKSSRVTNRATATDSAKQASKAVTTATTTKKSIILLLDDTATTALSICRHPIPLFSSLTPTSNLGGLNTAWLISDNNNNNTAEYYVDDDRWLMGDRSTLIIKLLYGQVIGCWVCVWMVGSLSRAADDDAAVRCIGISSSIHDWPVSQSLVHSWGMTGNDFDCDSNPLYP
ncbi:hypothetical protein DFA_06659 [Cavenderia fasciculata]|uniref:Uncharacterized protein n=1 Tax=Cavenderia fasciculata TaxID=261658 RepID=F4Q1X3_CACFS|nr:uncharacterized protein DFA_06659 [Cavenderia fasciculata]EGG17993.1 hypothetical protein DFA_06659 [Cavenderia fasciculata]|eukprot:XP_004356885.1 hypothetical protein DFA_06659 [Cavenderia fasciculata]